MPYFSENDNLVIGENYTRGELCDLMNIDYGDEIEGGVFKPWNYSSILFFSTIHNNAGYINGKISDSEFLYSANNQNLDPEIKQHQFTGKELLLFVRIDQETGFYYFGKCNYSGNHRLPNYPYPLYVLKLKDTTFSQMRDIEIPILPV